MSTMECHGYLLRLTGSLSMYETCKLLHITVLQWIMGTKVLRYGSNEMEVSQTLTELHFNIFRRLIGIWNTYINWLCVFKCCTLLVYFVGIHKEPGYMIGLSSQISGILQYQTNIWFVWMSTSWEWWNYWLLCFQISTVQLNFMVKFVVVCWKSKCVGKRWDQTNTYFMYLFDKGGFNNHDNN